MIVKGSGKSKHVYVYMGGRGFLRKPIQWVKNLFKRRKAVPKPLKHKQSHVQTHAKIASESYTPHIQRKKSIDGYQYKKDLSHDRRAIYHHPSKKHTIIGQRGTVVSDVNDLLDDTQLATGQDLRQNNRFKQESKFLKDYGKYNKDHKVSLTGHSLGSAYSSRLAHEHGIESHGFNEGSSPHPKVIVDHLKHSLNPKINKYQVKTDIISATNPFATESISKKEGQSSHSIKNFIGSGKLTQTKLKMLVDLCS